MASKPGRGRTAASCFYLDHCVYQVGGISELDSSSLVLQKSTQVLDLRYGAVVIAVEIDQHAG